MRRVWRTSHRTSPTIGGSSPVRDRISRQPGPCPPATRRTRARRATAADPATEAGTVPASAASRAGAATPTARRLRPARPVRAPHRAPARRRGPGDGLVVGTVPAGARVTGVLLVLAALAGRGRVFPTYLVVGGEELSAVDRLRQRARRACSSRWPTWRSASGCCAAPSPSSASPTPASPERWRIGQLLIEIYRGSSSTVPARRSRCSRASGCSPAASRSGPAGSWAWSRSRSPSSPASWPPSPGAARSWRTAERLDPVRSLLAGAAVLLGVGDRPVPDPAGRRRPRPAWSPTRRPGWRPWSPRRVRRRCSSVRDWRCWAACCSPAPWSSARSIAPVAAAAPGRGRRAARDHRRRPRRPPWPACGTRPPPTTWSGPCPAPACLSPASGSPAHRRSPGGCAAAGVTRPTAAT